MNRVNKILFDPEYQRYFRDIQSLEADRKFCGHTMEHFLAVARLSFIIVQKEELNIDQEVVYAAALLHDIGRALEYVEGTPHHEGSVNIAREILPRCSFDAEEIEVILQAIEGHRKVSGATGFSAIFRRADKLSRNCFDCSVASECNWPNEKKNTGVTL